MGTDSVCPFGLIARSAAFILFSLVTLCSRNLENFWCSTCAREWKRINTGPQKEKKNRNLLFCFIRLNA